MEATYTCRKSRRQNGETYFAEITIQANRCESPSRVTLSTAVLEYLQTTFGDDLELQRHNVQAAIVAQIGMATADGRMAHLGDPSFSADVICVSASEGMDRELAGYLLSMAGMGAINAYLDAYDQSQQASDGREFNHET